MAFIGSMLGAGQGSGYQAMGGVNQLQANSVTPDQVNSTYGGAQSGLAQQQALVNALQGQQAQGIQGQTQLAQQLSAQAQGQGPNPAQAQLNQNTSQNVAAQNALMAGQRGANQNVGLIARQAAQQGATTQQNSIGQAASLQAQQQLNAQQQLAALSGNQIGQAGGAVSGYSQAAQSEQGNILNANTAYTNAQANVLGSQNSANSQIAVQNSKAQQGIFGGLLGGAGALFADGGEVGPTPIQPMPQVGTQQPAGPQSSAARFLKGFGTTVNQQGGLNAQGQPMPGADANPIQGGANGLSSALFKQIKKAFQSGPAKTDAVDPNATATDASDAAATNGQMLDAGRADQLQGTATEAGGAADAAETGAATGAATDAVAGAALDATAGAASDLGALALVAKGGRVPALVSPGEVYLDPKDVNRVKQGANPLKTGEKIPGKPKVGGAKNSYANDTVRKDLEEGGIVLPRSVTRSSNPEKKAAEFVAKVLRQKK